MGVEEVDRLEALAAHLRVEVESARGESSHLHDAEHHLGGEVEVGRELVGVPADEFVAGVGIDGAEGVGPEADLDLVGHGVAGEGGVVGLEVHLEMILEAVFAQEVEAGGRVAVVLVGGRLLGLGLDVELALESDLLLVVDGHLEEAGEVIEFALHVGVPEGGVAFAATPEGVSLATEFVGDFHRLLHLGRGVGVDIGVGAGGRSVEEAGIGEEAGGAPEKLDAGALLLLLEDGDDGVEVLVALGKGLPLGGDIAVVEGVVGGAQLLDKLEGVTDAVLGVLDGVGAVIPGADGRAGAEGIGE